MATCVCCTEARKRERKISFIFWWLNVAETGEVCRGDGSVCEMLRAECDRRYRRNTPGDHRSEHKCLLTHTHMHIFSCIYARVCIYKFTYDIARFRTHSRTHARARRDTHTHTHTHTHTLTLTHTHTHHSYMHTYPMVILRRSRHMELDPLY